MLGRLRYGYVEIQECIIKMESGARSSKRNNRSTFRMFIEKKIVRRKSSAQTSALATCTVQSNENTVKPPQAKQNACTRDTAKAEPSAKKVKSATCAASTSCARTPAERASAGALRAGSRWRVAQRVLGSMDENRASTDKQDLADIVQMFQRLNAQQLFNDLDTAAQLRDIPSCCQLQQVREYKNPKFRGFLYIFAGFSCFLSFRRFF